MTRTSTTPPPRSTGSSPTTRTRSPGCSSRTRTRSGRSTTRSSRAGLGAVVHGLDDVRVDPRAREGRAGPTRCRSGCSRHRDLPPDEGVTFVARGRARRCTQQMVAAAGGKDVWVVGGGDLAGQFADAGLLDEVITYIAPVTLGSGRPLLPRRLELRLEETAARTRRSSPRGSRSSDRAPGGLSALQSGHEPSPARCRPHLRRHRRLAGHRRRDRPPARRARPPRHAGRPLRRQARGAGRRDHAPRAAAPPCSPPTSPTVRPAPGCSTGSPSSA